MRVVRLCSVFEPPPSCLDRRGARFDPIGGMQNHTAELSRNLDALGVAQTIVTTRPPGAPGVESLGQRSHVVRLGYPVRRFRQLYCLPASRVVPSLVRNADLIHAHVGEDLAVLPIAVRAARRHGTPLVMTLHCSLGHTLRVTDGRSLLLKLLGGRIESWGERSADAVITLTTRVARLLEQAGMAPGRLHVIPSGVDAAIFSKPTADPLPSLTGRRILYAGRLGMQKGVDTLVEAVPLLRHRDASLVVVGDGPRRPLVERAARRHPGRVHVVGFVAHERIPAYMAHADVLVLPSRYEELGSVLLEGMQAGVPVVASDVGGIPEVVTDGVTGLLVPPADPRALAAALDRVLGEPELVRRLSGEARARSVDYRWPVLAERVLDVYRGVLGRPLQTSSLRAGDRYTAGRV